MTSINNSAFISPQKAFFTESYLQSQMRLISVLMAPEQKNLICKIINTLLSNLFYLGVFQLGEKLHILTISNRDPFLEEICRFLCQRYPTCNLHIYAYELDEQIKMDEFKFSVDYVAQSKSLNYSLCSSYVAVPEDQIFSFSDGLFSDLPFCKDAKGICHVSILSLLLKISKKDTRECNIISNACDKVLKGKYQVSNLEKSSQVDFHVNTPEHKKSTFVRFQVSGSATFETVVVGNQSTIHFPSIIPVSSIRRSKQAAIIYKRQPQDNWSGMPLDCEKIEFTIAEKDITKKMLFAYLNRGGGGNPVISAVIAGAGCRHSYAEDYGGFTEGIPVCWGVLRNSKKILDDAKFNDQHFIYIDHAYFNRGHGNSYRICVNSYESNTMKICPSKRSELLNVSLKPWNTQGTKIIVCPPTEYFAEAHSVHGWLHNTVNELKLHTDRKIVVRNKPKPGEKALPLVEQLKQAHALVTHSSNVAIEAACLGTPVFVSATSASSPIGLTDLSMIETPIYPNRSMWINNLAYCQFDLSEVKSGEFLNIINEYHSFDWAPESKDKHY